MPNYEYVCKAGHEFERKQKITDAPLKTCPRQIQRPPGNTCAISMRYCGESVKRLISKGSFTLKGGGWGRDGYS